EETGHRQQHRDTDEPAGLRSRADDRLTGDARSYAEQRLDASMQCGDQPHRRNRAEDDPADDDVDAESDALDGDDRFGESLDELGIFQADPDLGDIHDRAQRLVDDDDQDGPEPDLRTRFRVADHGAGDIQSEEHLE